MFSYVLQSLRNEYSSTVRIVNEKITLKMSAVERSTSIVVILLIIFVVRDSIRVIYYQISIITHSFSPYS